MKPSKIIPGKKSQAMPAGYDWSRPANQRPHGQVAGKVKAGRSIYQLVLVVQLEAGRGVASVTQAHNCCTAARQAIRAAQIKASLGGVSYTKTRLVVKGHQVQRRRI
jgi:hypothetical protein